MKRALIYCGSFSLLLVSSVVGDGKYPKTVDIIAGKPVPQLIRLTDFYDSSGDTYRFHFRYSADFWDNVWAYRCGPQQICDWLNYDEN
jgi:hypothetical protein